MQAYQEEKNMSELEKILNLKFEENIAHSIPESWRAMAGEDYHPFLVLTENVLNALDELSILKNQGAKLTKEQSTVKIEVHRTGTTPYIKISDSLGKFTEESLRGIVEKTGRQQEKKQRKLEAMSDEKRKCLDVFGWRGIGAHCYRAAFPSIVFVTRPEDAKATYALRMDKPLNEESNPREYAPFTRNAVHARSKIGTDVYLIGNIEHSDWTKLMPRAEKLAEKLGQVFRPWIQEGIAIEVTDGKQTFTAQPPKFIGIELYREKFPIEGLDVKGSIELALWYNPDEDPEHKVEVRHKGAMFVDDICKIGDLSTFPFTEGRLTGYVDEDICKWAGNKKGLDYSNKGDKEFINIMGNVIIPKIEPLVKAKMKEQSELETAKLYSRVNRILGYVVRNSDVPYDGGVTKKEEEEDADKKKKKKTEKDEKDDTPKPPICPTNPSVPKMNIKERPFEKSTPSYYDKDQKRLHINTAHPEYIKEVAAGRRLRYLSIHAYSHFLQEHSHVKPGVGRDYEHKLIAGMFMVDRCIKGEADQ
jgi:hypothetical protein